MTPILLPISALRRHNACHLSRRLRDYRAHHGHTPGRSPTLRSWLACTPDVQDWLWATRCLSREGRILGLEVATRAARRALAAAGWDHADPRPLRAVEAAEVILAAYWRGEEPTEAMRDAAYAAANANAAYAAYAAYAADAAADAADAAYAASRGEPAGTTGAGASERAQQRADYLAALDRLEAR